VTRRLLSAALAFAIGGACAWALLTWAEPDEATLEDTEEAFLV
jgi:hypothetical protein